MCLFEGFLKAECLFFQLWCLESGNFAETDWGAAVEDGEAQAACLYGREAKDALVANRGGWLAGIYRLPLPAVVILYAERFNPLPEGNVLL